MRNRIAHCLGAVSGKCRPMLIAWFVPMSGKRREMQQYREPRRSLD
jgi:hypothetical protein